jgi:uncharacterized protein
MKLDADASAPVMKKKVKAPEVKKQADFKRPEQKKRPEAAKKPEPAKKTVFNTAMADALAKLKRN